jgi:5-methylcytosine-specific restriction endonuclease McrA
MPQRTCGVDGCPKPHRARGLCSSHYNRQHPAPGERHRKRAVACSVCGKQVLKYSSGARRPVCSTDCRWFLQFDGASTPVPVTSRAHPGHEAYLRGRLLGRFVRTARMAILRAEREAVEAERRAQIATLMQPRDCDDCGESYTPRTTVQRFCSVRCLRRVERRKRKALEYNAAGSYTWTQVIHLFRLFGRCCAYCAQPVKGQPDPDHVVPLAKGGHNGISNILPACRACNCDKRDVPIGDWNADRARRGLPPRITTWSPLDPRYVHLSPM